MIERKTVLEQPELNRSGVLGVKIALLLIDNGIEIDCKWHRTSIPLEVDPVAQMAAVNAQLEMMEPPVPPISKADIDFIVQCRGLLTQRYAV